MGCTINKPEEKSEVPVRAFVRVTDPSGDYTPMQIVMKSDDMMERLMASARKEMECFVHKYGDLEELSGVIESMNTVLAAAG